MGREMMNSRDSEMLTSYILNGQEVDVNVAALAVLRALQPYSEDDNLLGKRVLRSVGSAKEKEGYSHEPDIITKSETGKPLLFLVRFVNGTVVKEVFQTKHAFICFSPVILPFFLLVWSLLTALRMRKYFTLRF